MLCSVKSFPRLKIIWILLKNKFCNFNLLELLQVNMVILEFVSLQSLSLGSFNFLKASTIPFPILVSEKLWIYNIFCLFILNQRNIKRYMVRFFRFHKVNLQKKKGAICYMTHCGPNFVSTPLQLDWRIHIKPIQSWPCNCGILHAPCVVLQSNLMEFIKKSNTFNDMSSWFHAFIYLCPNIEHKKSSFLSSRHSTILKSLEIIQFATRNGCWRRCIQRCSFFGQIYCLHRCWEYHTFGHETQGWWIGHKLLQTLLNHYMRGCLMKNYNTCSSFKHTSLSYV